MAADPELKGPPYEPAYGDRCAPKRYEYLVEMVVIGHGNKQAALSEALNALGEDGWEVLEINFDFMMREHMPVLFRREKL